MNFPVANKTIAILKGSYIMIFQLIIFIILYLYNSSVSIIYTALAILIPTVVLLLFYIKKRNIQSLELYQNELLVSYKKKKIRIPLSEICEISSALNYGTDFKFKMTKTYIILLKSTYNFGNKLYVDSKIIKNTFEEDPLSIKVLKLELQRLQNRENNKL